MPLPASDEIEISVFSKGIGECIVLHLGNGHWVIVDSFLNGDVPVAQAYLEHLKVDPAQVDLLVFTHWHDDHIKGAALLSKWASSAKVAMPLVMCGDEFTGFLRHQASIRPVKYSSGVSEMIAVLRQLHSTPARRYFAMANRNLLVDNANGFWVEALSPSDEDIALFLAEIDRWQATAGLDRRAARPRRNDTSVAIVCGARDKLILLGADLEVRSQLSGWQAVHENAWNGRGEALFFKIPHHGSVTGHYEGIWLDCLRDQPFAVLTPFGKGPKKLPSPADIERICELTPHAYTASLESLRTAARQHNSVERTLREASIKLYREGAHGHIRCRSKDGEAAWRVEEFGTAAKLKSIAA